jgi:hypothetical protein
VSEPFDSESLLRLQQSFQRDDIIKEYTRHDAIRDTDLINDSFTQASQVRKLTLSIHAYLQKHELVFSSPVLTSLLQDVPLVAQGPYRAIEQFRSHPGDFVSAVVHFCDRHPDYVDHVTFSLVPSFFQLLASFLSQAEFTEFLRAAMGQNLDLGLKFARLPFALPEFQEFLDGVIASMAHRLAKVTGTSTCCSFLDEFLTLIPVHSGQIPPVVFQLLGFQERREIFRRGFLDVCSGIIASSSLFSTTSFSMTCRRPRHF